MIVDRHEITGWRDAEALGATLNRQQRDVVLLRIKRHRHAQLLRLSTWHVHGVQIEIVLIDDAFAIGRNARKENAAIVVIRDLLWRPSLGRHAPDVIWTVTFSREINHSICAPHGEHTVRHRLELLQIGVGDLGDVAILHIHHRDGCGRVAAIFLAPCRWQIAIESDHGAVLTHHPRARDSHAQWRGNRAVDRLNVQRRTPRICTALTRHHNALAVGCPVQRFITARKPRQLLRFSTICRHHVHIVVAVAIRRECDPSAIRRKARGEIAGDVCRQSTRIRAVRVDDPDVVLIAEGDASIVGNSGESRKPDRLGCLCPQSGCADARRCTGANTKAQREKSGRRPSAIRADHANSQQRRRCKHSGTTRR